ncbi:helix-turn-helix domain-containing protein [Streptomyces cinnamoneus]|uniref:nSTAND1 domain-containing NTPase n=1 Tax=Streptomyces cinnamoneus TaxID=53446 RepID=UPI0034266170
MAETVDPHPRQATEPEGEEAPQEAPQEAPTFGTELRRRRKAARMSLATLAVAALCDKSYISRVENGHRQPDEDFARRCDDTLEAGGALLTLAASRPEPCPFRGLAPFRTEDAHWFFGRERAVADLVCLLGDPSTEGRPVMVVGPSGAGKSSLLHAGLAPAVTGGALPGRLPGTPSVLSFTPTAEPMRQLQAQAAHRPLLSRALVIVDQFEELFTIAPEGERDPFADALCHLAAGGLPVVIGIRADFYGHCLAHAGLREALRSRALPLGPMSEKELRQAISEPAAKAGLALEPGLVEILLRDLGVGSSEAAGSLPLLSHALRSTWQLRTDGVLTVAAYERIGGIRGAVATTAERAYGRLTPEQREVARRMLLGLVRVGDDGADTRRRAERADRLEPDAGTVLEEFTRARLLTADTDHVEITHEALLDAWPRLRGWINSDRAALRLRQKLADAAASWDREGRDDSLLYRGSRLAAAEEWAAGHRAETIPSVAAFLKAGRRHEQRGIRRLRRLVAGLTALALAATAALVFAVVKKVEADGLRDAATSGRLAAQSELVRASNPALAMQLAAAALATADTPEARGAVLSLSTVPYVTRYLAGDDRTGRTDATGMALSPDGRLMATGTQGGAVRLWHTADHGRRAPVTVPVSAGPTGPVSFHPGRVLAVLGGDGRVRLWDLTGPRPAAHPHLLPGAPGSATALAYSGDGSRLIAADSSGRITLWDSAKDPLHPAYLHQWQGHDRTVRDLAISRDGHTAATLGADHTVKVWDLDDPRNPVDHDVRRSQQDFTKIALSPDGRTLALAEYPGDCEVWTARVGADRESEEPQHLFDSVSTVSSLAFSPDGTRLAVSHTDSGVHLWNVRERRRATSLPQADGTVGAAFGPDNSSLAVGTRTGGNALWRLPAHLTGHTAPVSGLKTSPDRTLAVTTGKDRTARLWRISARYDPVPGQVLLCEGHTLKNAAFSPDARTLALTTFADEGQAAVCLLDITDPDDPHQLDHWTAHGGNDINAAAFSNDGRTLVTGGNDGQAVLWSVATPGQHHELTRRGRQNTFDDVTGLAVLPGSGTLVIGTTRQGAQLWDIRTPQEPQLVQQLPGAVQVASIAVSAKDRLAVGTHDDHKVYLWDATDPNRPVSLPTLSGHSTPVWAADFTPDGHHLFTTSSDQGGPARLWDLTNPDDPQLDAVLHGSIGVGTFTSATSSLIAATGDESLRTWSTDARAAAKDFCARAGTPMTADERRPYLDADGSATPCQ